MHPETPLAQHRMARLRAEADLYRLAAQAKHPRHLRIRLGWTLVEVGLRLATPKPALAH